ncbi:hypothetical protein MTO96_023300, partial [Rhipicephalus appendiculatus]
MDDGQFREAGHQLLDFALSYFNGLRNRPVLPDVAPGYLAALVPPEAPQEPDKWEDIFKDIERVILPGSTASECTLTAVLAAKTKVTTFLLQQNPSLTPSQVWDKLVVYASCQAHSSVERAALLACVRFHVLNTDDKLAVRGPTLRAVVQEDRNLGFIPMAVNDVMCDGEEEGIWLHVDAAYAGSSFICPEFRHYMKGIQHVSSFSMNPHKWLLVNVDCSAMWFRKRTDIEEAFKVNPLYLKHDNEGGKVPDYRHWTIPLGRRFRSLKLWFVFRCYGVSGLQAHIRRHIDLAKEFEQLVKEHEHFEVVVPVTMALVCFRFK